MQFIPSRNAGKGSGGIFQAPTSSERSRLYDCQSALLPLLIFVPSRFVTQQLSPKPINKSIVATVFAKIPTWGGLRRRLCIARWTPAQNFALVQRSCTGKTLSETTEGPAKYSSVDASAHNRLKSVPSRFTTQHLSPKPISMSIYRQSLTKKGYSARLPNRIALRPFSYQIYLNSLTHRNCDVKL